MSWCQSQFSSSSSRMSAYCAMPTMSTTCCTRPNAETASPTSRSVVARSVTSPIPARPPTSAAISTARSGSLSMQNTRPPTEARACAACRPMPCPAPTRTTPRPSSRSRSANAGTAVLSVLVTCGPLPPVSEHRFGPGASQSASRGRNRAAHRGGRGRTLCSSPVQLAYSESERHLATEVRAWLADALPRLPPRPARDDWDARRRFDTDWQRMLFDAGYAGIHWPRAYGGREASPTEQLMFLEETDRAGAPVRRRQLRRHAARRPDHHRRGHRRADAPLPARDPARARRSGARASPSRRRAPTSRRCARGPCATATSTSSTARRSGARYAHVADYCELLVRTDPDAPKHKGITWLIVPDGRRRASTIRPLAHHRRAVGVLRGVLRRRARAGRQPGRRRERRVARRHGHVRLRAGHGVRGRDHRGDAAVPPARGHRPARRGTATAPRGTTSSCGARSGGRRRVRRAVVAHRVERLARRRGAAFPGPGGVGAEAPRR